MGGIFCGRARMLPAAPATISLRVGFYGKVIMDFSMGAAWKVAGELDFSPQSFAVGGKDDGVRTCRYTLPRVYETIGAPLMYERARDLAREIELAPGARQFVIVSGNFVFGDVLEALTVGEGRLYPRRVSIQTLSMSRENVDSLRNVVEACPLMESLRIVLSDYFFAHERRRDGLVPYLCDVLDTDAVDFDVAFASLHTKIVSIETLGGNFVVMDGSANLRSSRNIEQFRIECDEGLYRFVEDFTDRVFRAYSVVNKDRKRPKGVRSHEMWDMLAEMAKGA